MATSLELRISVGLCIVGFLLSAIFIILYVKQKHRLNRLPSARSHELNKSSVHLRMQDALIPDPTGITSIQVPHFGQVAQKVFRIRLIDGQSLNNILGGRPLDDSAISVTERNLGDTWKTVIADDTKADEFFAEFYGRDHAVTQAYNAISPQFNAARADILRLALLYVHGGMYLDYKSAYVSSRRPRLAINKDVGVCQWGGQMHLFPKGEYANWFFLARSGSPLIWTVLIKICKNIQFLQKMGTGVIPLFSETAMDNESTSKRMVVSTTGPIVSTRVFMRFPTRVDTSWSKDVIYNNTHSKGVTATHYSKMPSNTFLTEWANNEQQPFIPRRLFATYLDRDAIPNKVMKRIHHMHPDLTIEVSPDSECRKFIFSNFPNIVGETFDKLKIGAHKAELWRYCKLYVCGGFYCDIKTDFIRSLVEFSELAPVHPYTWYTVIGNYRQNSYHVLNSNHRGRQLYNGIIITPPFNPILYKAITHICTTKATDYHFIVRKLYDLVQDQLTVQITPGLHSLKNGWKVYLAKEMCLPDQSARYGIRCNIQDGNNESIVRTRYDGYGMGTGDWI